MYKTIPDVIFEFGFKSILVVARQLALAGFTERKMNPNIDMQDMAYIRKDLKKTAKGRKHKREKGRKINKSGCLKLGIKDIRKKEKKFMSIT